MVVVMKKMKFSIFPNEDTMITARNKRVILCNRIRGCISHARARNTQYILLHKRSQR